MCGRVATTNECHMTKTAGIVAILNLKWGRTILAIKNEEMESYLMGKGVS